jgi:Domain of unknown function (DUF4124)
MKLKLNAVFTSILGFSLLLLPLLGNADIYKWKDKTGATRYADLPPEGNQKHETIGRKKVTKSVPIANSETVTKGNVTNETTQAADGSDDNAAELRQKNAELDKQKREKETQAKIKNENCAAAKANLKNFTQGARVYKVNEKGEPVYFDDKELKQGEENSRKDISDYCN